MRDMSGYFAGSGYSLLGVLNQAKGHGGFSRSHRSLPRQLSECKIVLDSH